RLASEPIHVMVGTGHVCHPVLLMEPSPIHRPSQRPGLTECRQIGFPSPSHRKRTGSEPCKDSSRPHSWLPHELPNVLQQRQRTPCGKMLDCETRLPCRHMSQPNDRPMADLCGEQLIEMRFRRLCLCRYV